MTKPISSEAQKQNKHNCNIKYSQTNSISVYTSFMILSLKAVSLDLCEL